MEFVTGTRQQEAERWMREAAREAASALCLRGKCGAVIVKDGAVIGRGYNAPPLDKTELRMCEVPRGERRADKTKFDLTCCMHAEWRAIMDALHKNPDDIAGAELYFVCIDEATGVVKKSGKPYCTVCSRLALDTGIADFFLWHEEGIAAYPTEEYNRLSYEYHLKA